MPRPCPPYLENGTQLHLQVAEQALQIPTGRCAKIIRADLWSVREGWPNLPKRIVSNFQGMNVEARMDLHGVCSDAGLALQRQGVYFRHPLAAHRLQSVGHSPVVAALAPPRTAELFVFSPRTSYPACAHILRITASLPMPSCLPLKHLVCSDFLMTSNGSFLLPSYCCRREK